MVEESASATKSAQCSHHRDTDGPRQYARLWNWSRWLPAKRRDEPIMGEVPQVEALQRRGRGNYRFRGAYTKGALCIAVLATAGFGAFRLAWDSLGEPPLARADAMSVTVLDRHGRLLRAFTTADDHWRLPLDVADTDPRYLQMLMAFEDRRFRQHAGVDLIAVGRAATQFVRNGRIVSGASTLTMQVVRLVDSDRAAAWPATAAAPRAAPPRRSTDA